MSSDLTWNNETRHLRDLKPQQDNPRTISESQAKRLLESWDEYNQVETLAIGPDGTIYNGHQRYYTLLALGNLDLQVDVRVSSRTLTKDEWRKLTVFLHQGTVGEWDFEALRGWDTERLLESWNEWMEDCGEILRVVTEAAIAIGIFCQFYEVSNGAPNRGDMKTTPE